MIKVLIVDDDPLVRAGLRLLLGGAGDVQVVGEAADGDEAPAAVAEHAPDVVLMDIRMARVDGLSAARQLLAQPDAPKVIMLTTFDADDMVLQSLRSGAAGFLLKDTSPPQMIEAIRKVTAGEQFLSPSVISQVISLATQGQETSRQDAARAELDTLTERELEVAVAIGGGASNAEIAASLFMSLATVKAYVTRIFTKLDITNRVQLAIKVHDAGMIEPVD